MSIGQPAVRHRDRTLYIGMGKKQGRKGIGMGEKQGRECICMGEKQGRMYVYIGENRGKQGGGA